MQALNELEVECLPMDIPTSVDLDISELEIGDSLKVGDLTLDDKVTAKSNAEQIIVSVTQAMKEEVVVVEEDEELEEGEEGATEEGDSGEESKDKDADSKDNEKKTEDNKELPVA